MLDQAILFFCTIRGTLDAWRFRFLCVSKHFLLNIPREFLVVHQCDLRLLNMHYVMRRFVSVQIVHSPFRDVHRRPGPPMKSTTDPDCLAPHPSSLLSVQLSSHVDCTLLALLHSRSRSFCRLLTITS